METNNETNNEKTNNDINIEAKEILIPKSRLDEVQAKRDEIQQELERYKAGDNNNGEEEPSNAEPTGEELDADDAEAEKEMLAKLEDIQAQTETLKEQTEALRKRELELIGSCNDVINSWLGSIPEQYRDLVPQNGDILETLQWLSKAEQKGLLEKKKDNSKQAIGKKTNGSKARLTDELRSALSGTLGMISAGYKRD